MEDDIAARAAAQVAADAQLCFIAATWLWWKFPTIAARLIARGAELVELAQTWKLAAAAEDTADNSRTAIR